MACADSSVEIGPLINSEDELVEAGTILQGVAPSKFRVNKVVSVIVGAAVALVATAGVYKAWQYKVQLEVDSSGDATSLEEEASKYVVDRSTYAQSVPNVFFESVAIEGVQMYDGQDTNGLIASPKSGSNPGIVILPGSGGTKERQDAWITFLAGRGIVSLTIDSNGNDQTPQIKAALSWMKSSSNPYKKYLKTSDISIMGYSAGGGKMNEYLIEGNECLKGYKNFISMAGIRSTIKDDKPASALISGGGYLAIQSADDADMGFSGVEPFVENVGKVNGNKAYALCYNGGGHQPFMNTPTWHEIAKFIFNINSYTPPYPCDTASKTNGYNTGLANTKLETGAKGSMLSGMAFNTWTSGAGPACCKGYCLQTKECTSYDLKTTYNDDLQNCFLYR